MPDYGAEFAEKVIENVLRKIRKVYADANKTAEKNLQAFVDEYAKEDEKKQAQLLAGKISPGYYAAWQRQMVFNGERWKKKVEQTVRVYVDAEKAAWEMVNNERVDVFAENANFFAYRFERDTKAAVSFDLLDRHTVENLIKSEPDLLPQKTLNTEKTQEYTRKQVTKSVTQGIILGEAIPKIAERIQKKCGMNIRYAETYARTAVTSAQNAGRTYMVDEARDMGIKVKRQWIATLDSRTRPEHQHLDGQNEDKDGLFRVGSYVLRYPGDPNAAPRMVENCRCTLGYDLQGYPSSGTRLDNKTKRRIQYQTYDEWKGSKTLSGIPEKRKLSENGE